jgi:hypothetical protein
MKITVARVVAESAAKRKALVPPDGLTCLGKDLRSIWFDSIVAGESPQ